MKSIKILFAIFSLCICTLSLSQQNYIQINENKFPLYTNDANDLAYTATIDIEKPIILFNPNHSIEARLRIGDVQFLTGQYSSPLRFPAPEILTHAYVSKVGGVSFQQTLSTDKNISIKYISDNTDGRRLQVKINGKKFYPSLADWQLKPIANFAHTEFHAAVSAFGIENDMETPFVYHTAFQNNLLGLRLLQADIILTYPEKLYHLPTYEGTPVLGQEETGSEINLKGTEQVGAFIRKAASNKQSSSYVLTDNNVTISLSDTPSDQTLFTIEKPYYHFWKEQNIRDSAIEQRLDSLHLTYFIKASQLRPLIIGEETFDSIDYYKDFLYNLSSFNEHYLNDIRQILKEGKKAAIPNEELIETFALHYYPLLEQINPPVFEAVQNTMNYAALFRYVKANKPKVWQKFISEIRDIPILPVVETPNDYYSDSSK